MKTPKTLFGFPIKEDNNLSLKEGSVKFGGALIIGPEMKEVKFIGGPLDGRVVSFDRVITKVVLRKSENKDIAEDIEYKIKQDENGDWFGETI